MKFRRSIAVVALACLLGAVPANRPAQTSNTCLAFLSENLAKGRQNFYTYFIFSDQRAEVREGDVLSYSIFLDPKNPVAKGGIDADFSDGGTPLRDLHLSDERGIDSHGDGLLTPAVGQWYERRIPLKGQAGRTFTLWRFAFEGDAFGKYVQWIDDLAIQHADGTRTPIYVDGPPVTRRLEMSDGYTKYPFCVVVDRSKVKPGADLTALVAQLEVQGKKLADLQKAREDIALVKAFLKSTPDPAVEGHLKEAEAMLNAVEQKDASAEEVQAVLHAANHALSHTHPVMRKYTGDLVGHAHIDLQWLWEWQEGLVVTHDTFNQAVKFMNEFPGFTFSQSSSWLYQAVEEQYPELFKQIQQKVKKGQWELVGGRVCEGDTNMISPESHARQFLYGQRYFREKFGKTAKVAWEPDTFGHTAQMPQIAKLGGCDSYYFCRGGKETPLFWWSALDGTKVLAFDEPASGSWYNGDLSYGQFREMLDFEKKTGSKDMLWVYGVGNHGGGPTREMIETALGWMKDPAKPKVRFATATEFFDKLRTYDLKKIPTIQSELNPVFDGCYTTHSEVKQANRQAEAMTSAAEAIATLASLHGFKYPKEAFRRNWEEICYNHHHDTLPGSGVHAPYEKTKIQLGRVVAEDRDIIQRAMESMTVRVTAPKGVSQMVFNPTGWTRSGWVEAYLVHSGWDQDSGVRPEAAVAIAPDGTKYPVQVVDALAKKVRFWAGAVPAFGYKVFRFESGPSTGRLAVGNPFTVETSRFRVSIDREKGVISSLYDKRANRELAKGGLGRLEAHFEGPGGMSAWVIGKISRVVPLEVISATVEPGGNETRFRIEYRLPAHNSVSKESRFVQTIHIDEQTSQIDVDVAADWNAVGTGNEPTPMVRVAFDTGLESPTATYETPFGSVSRPTDNTEGAALQWGDLRDARGGLAILNDSKHGYSAAGSTMRLTLIRSSYEPDPVPNPGHHVWRYALVPHGPEANGASLTKIATEFNIPLFSASVPYDAHGDAPLQFSVLSLSDDRVVPTALKRSEDGSDLVVRAFMATKDASAGSIGVKTPVASAEVVNFIEDRMGPATVSGSTIALPLRGFEIKTVKVKLPKVRQKP